MRFLEVPALITEDIEDPNIVDITEPITASISGTTLTIDGGDKVSGEVTITLTNDVTVSTVTTSNIKQPSIHKIIIKTNGAGNFTYVPNDGVTASSVSTTTKTGSDLDILLITTSGGDTYLDLDLADYVSPAANFSNVLTGFNITDLTSAYGTTAKLYKPDGTLLTTVNSAATGSGVNFGYTETDPGDVIYKLEVTDDVGRKSKYNLPRKWINYAMETTSTPGFQKFALSGNDYTSTVTLPSLGSSSKARIHKTTDHGYMGIKFRIQGRNSPSDDWVDVDDTGENENADESAEFLAFGNYTYQRVWVKPTAKATTTVSSSNVVTLTLSNVTEDVTTKTITGTDPFEIDETSNVFVFEETAKIGTIPYTVTVGTETYTNAVTATTEQIGDIETKTFHTDVIESNILYKHLNRASDSWQVSGSNDGNWITYSDGSSHPQFYKGSPESGYTLIQTVSNAQGATGTLSYDGLYHIGNNHGNTNATLPILKRTGDTFAAHSSDLTKHASVSYGPIAWSPNSYNFAVTDATNEKIYFYEFDSSNETWSTTWNSGSLTSTIGDISWFGRMSTRLSKDGEYLVTGDHSPENTRIFKCDWTSQTVTLQHTQTGNSGAAAIDYNGEYVITGYNSANTKILKRSGTTWTDVTTSEGFTNLPYIRNGAQFLGVPSQYLLTGEYNTPGQTSNQYHTFMYKWKGKKEVTLTYNGKDMLTLAHKGGLTTTSVKLYKDDILYHTFGASETSVVIAEAGVYQAIADDKYYSLKVTVTTITETQAELYMSHRECFLLKKDGKVWYWGEATNGGNATGNNTTVNVATLNDNLSALPSGIKQIGRAAVDPHCRCAITNDGKLYTWGYNGHGGLGRGNTTDYTNQGPWLVSTQSSNTFTFCHSSYYSNFALQNNGYLWSCGYNGQYVLGTGNNSQQNTFYRINLPNVIDFDCNHDIALALTSDSEVYIWGTEGNSSMGGASGTTGTPTHLTTLDGKNIVKVRAGAYTGHAISSDGKMYSWGRNNNSQIPKGSNGNVTTPTEMTWFSRKNIKIVDIKLGHHDTAHLALDDQGNMYVWGIDNHGQLGNGSGDVTNYSVPILLKENIASISCGFTTCGCIDKFGQVYTWGDAQQGQQNWIHGSNSDTDITHPTSNNLSVGSSVVYDGFDKYLLGKDSTVTSNVTFGSNTVSLGTKSEVFISDPHTYKFKIMESGKTTYTSNVISSTPTRPTGRVYPPKSGTHKNVSLTASANTDNTWTIDGAVYGSGDYKASMNKTANHVNQCPYRAFNGMIDFTVAHTQNNVQNSDFQLHMPQKIKLTKYAMYSRSYTGEYTHAPRDWKVYGSNDNGTNWTELDSQTNQTVTAWGSQLDYRDTKREYTVSGNTKYFSSYKLDVTANGGSSYLILSQIEYYGDEEGFLSDDGFGKLTLDVKGDTSATSNIVFHSNTYVMGAARDLYITDTGEYTADIFGSNKHFLGSKTHTISTVDTVPGFTAAFHHGAFSASDYSSAYSSVSAAATAGFVYSDTPAGTYSWGTLAHVKERENPDFTANSTLHTDYSSTYGWTTNSGWEVSAKDEFNTTYPVWKAFNKNDGGDAWLSGSAPSTSSPQWIKIKYPSSQVIKSYVIKCRDNSSPRFPTAWKLQGANTDIGDTDTGWTDIGTEQTVSLWSVASEKSFDVSSNTTAYQYYRLRITGSRESASLSNSDYVAIGEWFLNTVNGDNTTNHDQYTRYTYTPASSITANVLRVAGGGGGGSTRGAGGGAGGLLYSENVSLSGTKSISVANGGRGCKIGGSGNQSSIQQGFDTTFSGLTTSVGGGRGAFSDPGRAGSGGSGGGGGPAFPTAGTGVSGQGYAGGNGNAGDNYNGGGGGGAGGVGATGSGVGGVGLDYSSVFGTTYGVSGWFAGGGGGGQQSGGLAGGQGGGGTIGTNSGHGVNHTGGGGGGSGTSVAAGSGGSGIVIIKKLGAANPPALNFDGYNKLSIDNIVLSKNKIVLNELIPITSVAIDGTASNNVSYANHAWKCVEVHSDYLLFDHWNTSTNALDTTIPTIRQWKYTAADEIRDVGTDIPYRFRTKDSSGNLGSWYGSSSNDAVLPLSGFTGTIQHTHSSNNSYGGEFTWPGHTFSNVSSEVVIKKDGAAFATTTSNTVYIRDEGTYTAEVTGLDAYVTEVSKVVSGDITEFPNYVNATSFYYGGGVVDNTGKLYTWGHNGFGDSGRGASDRVPTHVSSISDPVSNVWRGDPGFTMAAKTSTDKWYMWGRNTYSGVLGNTTNTGNVTTPEDVTAKVTTYFGDQTVSANKIIKMAMGEHHAAALTAGGKVWSWGNDFGYYSTGTGTNNSTVLVTPVLLTTDGSTQLTGITDIQSTYRGMSALDSSGNVWFWGGASTSMQYAYPTKLLDSTSISGIVGMATNGKSIYAWKSDGTFYTRGAGNYGQLANGADSNQYTSWQTVTTLQGKTIKKVFGGNENMFAWTDDGVYGVGRNNNYKLGEGSLSSRRNIWHKSTTLSALSIKEIDFGHATGLVLTTDGRGYMWGEDASNSMANALSGHQSGAAEATSISALSLVHIPSPSITYDGKNKLTVGGTNYADTSTVTYYSNTYNLGTAKTMYVKDVGEYVFKISGTDKYADSNVHVSSVDLAGATTKPISFDGYNKLTLISPGENAVSNVTLGATKYDMGSASTFYIKDTGTYDLEMSGSNVFALSNTVVGTLSTDKYDYSQSSSGQQKITASDGSSTEYFGRRCAISGDKMVVTASSDNSHQGAAYIFTKSGTTWSEQQKLTGSGLSSSTEPQFGYGADISGNYAIVGAYEEDTDGTNAGGAYIFNFSGGTWTQQARIVSSDIAAGDVFGYAVGIDGDYAIVGAQSADPGGSSNAGASYIFKRSGTSWTQQVKLTASDAAAGDDFGRDVAIKGDYVIVGCYSGEAAYIFKKDTGAETWTQKAILTASDAGGTDYFADNVSMSGDYVIVGAKANDSSKGAAYIFMKDTGAETWTQQAKLIASDAANSDQFGWSVSIDGDLAIVGSSNDDDGGSSSGSAYVFARDGTNWSQQVKLTASDAAASDVFGNSVAIDGDFVVVGARGDASGTGAAYIFQGVKSFPSLTFDNYNKLTVSNFNSTSNEWPPPRPWTTPATTTDSDTTGITGSNSGKDATWTISGAAYGNGVYSATCDTVILNSATNHGPWKLFSKTNINYGFHTSSVSTCKIELTMPESIVLGSYEIFHRGDSTVSDNNYPKDWTIEGSNDGTTWTVLDTRTNETYSDTSLSGVNSGRKYTVSGNSTSYNRYRMDITANNGGTHVIMGEWKLFASNPRTGTLTDPNGSTYALGQTQDTIYIRDTGDYTLDVTNNDQKAIVAKTVGTVSTPVISPFTSTQNDITITGGTENPARYYKFDTLNSNSSKLFYENYTISNDVHNINKGISFYYDANDNLVVNHNDTNGSGDPGAIENVTTSSGFLNSGVINASPGDIIRGRPGDNTSTLRVQYTVPTFNQGTPSLNFDNYNKLTVANVDSDATSNIDFFSNTYEMGSRKELIINDAGTYYANIYSSNTLALVKKYANNPFPTTETQKIVASVRQTYDHFGRAVSISGDYAIVGAFTEDHDAEMMC